MKQPFTATITNQNLTFVFRGIVVRGQGFVFIELPEIMDKFSSSIMSSQILTGKLVSHRNQSFYVQSVPVDMLDETTESKNRLSEKCQWMALHLTDLVWIPLSRLLSAQHRTLTKLGNGSYTEGEQQSILKDFYNLVLYSHANLFVDEVAEDEDPTEPLGVLQVESGTRKVEIVTPMGLITFKPHQELDYTVTLNERECEDEEFD